LENERGEGEGEEEAARKKAERRKPCTTAKIYRYQILNTVKIKGEKNEDGEMKDGEGIEEKGTRQEIED
jgi:hypothetical protein